MRRVVITGIGLVGPTGVGLEAFWQALLERRSAIGPVTRFDAASYPCRVAGEVRDRSYEALLDPRKLRTTTHATQLALGAAELAMRDARLSAGWYEPLTVGVCVGTAVGGWREAEQQYGILLERGARRVNPFIVSGAANHSPGVEVAGALAAQGAQITVSSGCVSSLQAIGHAASLVASGELDLCVAGGTESPLSPVVVASLGRTHELSTCNDDPGHASRPFDREHCGMVLSEGSCFVVLEVAENASRRGAPRYAEVLGCASSCDAAGLYGFDSTARPSVYAIHRLLERCAMNATDIDYICAHANSSPAFDRKETLVIQKAFGECVARIPVSSIKGVLGHPFGAAGAFQVAATALAIRHQTIPPTCNLENPDPECDLNHVVGAPMTKHIRNALVTSYGYGGVNAYLILAEPQQ